MISKKNILNLAVLLATAALTACGDDKGSSGTGPEAYIAESLSHSTTVKMNLDPNKPSVPLNNNLFFDPNTGRLNFLSDEERENSDISDPRFALGYADGFSTSMPLYITVDGRGFGDDLGQIAEGVSLFNVNTSSKLTYGVDFVASTLDDKIIVVPLKPFKPSTNYVLVLTNQIKDVQNEPIGMSRSYAGLNSHPYNDGKLGYLQAMLKGQKAIAEKFGIDPKTMVYSSTFTTGSVGDVMTETAKELLKLKTADMANFRANPDNLVLTDAYSLTLTKYSDGDNVQSFIDGLERVDAFKVSEKGAAFKLGFSQYNTRSPEAIQVLGKVNVTKGTVKLPYFLETDSKFKTTPFEPANPEASAVTRYSPIPKIKSLQEVKFILFTPKQDVLNGLDGGNLKGLVIYQHGVTSIKEDAYSFAADLVDKGLAVIAIDHPIHGERMVNGAVKAHTDDATPYLNLAALPVARDNMRQSVLDILGLRLALEGQYLDILPDGVVLSSGDNVNTDSALKLDSASIKFLGHSLGGMLGNTAMAIANETGASEYQFSSAVFAKSGGHIAELLSVSQEFGDVIRASIAKSLGVSQETKEFQSKFVAFKIAAQTLIDTVDPHSVVSSGLYPNDLPTLLIQVENDDTVPNHGYKVTEDGRIPKAMTAHFLGTEGLANALKASDESTKRYFASYKNGWHSSLLAPVLTEIMPRCLNDQADLTQGFNESCVEGPNENTESMRKVVVDFLLNSDQKPSIDANFAELKLPQTAN